VHRRENLIAAMLSGFKRTTTRTPDSGLRFRSLWWSIPGVVIAALIVAAIVFGRY
jgi:hypothetical protein